MTLSSSTSSRSTFLSSTSPSSTLSASPFKTSFDVVLQFYTRARAATLRSAMCRISSTKPSDTLSSLSLSQTQHTHTHTLLSLSLSNSAHSLFSISLKFNTHSLKHKLSLSLSPRDLWQLYYEGKPKYLVAFANTTSYLKFALFQTDL